MTAQTNPSCSEAASRSRLLPDEQWLEPLAEMPTLFSCVYRGAPSAGCVFRNGAVMLMPDRCSYEATPCLFNNLRAVEQSGDVEQITWQWAVVRLLGDS